MIGDLRTARVDRGCTVECYRSADCNGPVRSRIGLKAGKLLKFGIGEGPIEHRRVINPPTEEVLERRGGVIVARPGVGTHHNRLVIPGQTARIGIVGNQFAVEIEFGAFRSKGEGYRVGYTGLYDVPGRLEREILVVALDYCLKGLVSFNQDREMAAIVEAVGITRPQPDTVPDFVSIEIKEGAGLDKGNHL